MPGTTSVPSPHGPFGERLASLRKSVGLSQLELAELAEVSRRMIAYYETRDSLPPGHVLSALARALGVSVDELMGINGKTLTGKKEKKERTRLSQHVLRRVQAIERLPLKEKRQLLGLIDTFLEKDSTT